MSSRNTNTGGVLEAMVLPALKMGGYECDQQVEVGRRPGGRKHMVDAVARKDARRVLVSLKWQQVSGTAEQKVPFEIICLVMAQRTGSYDAAYLVLGGEGWTLRDFYVSGGLKESICYGDELKIVTLESFIALANQGRL